MSHDKSILPLFAIELEKYYEPLQAYARKRAPSETEIRSPVQNNFNAETLVSITLEKLLHCAKKKGMPDHFWTFAIKQFNWVYASEYRNMKRREELFRRKFGDKPVDSNTMDRNRDDEEGQLCA